MKRLFSLFLCLFITLSFSSCNGSDANGIEKSSGTTSTEKSDVPYIESVNSSLPYTFISKADKASWKEKLTALLPSIEIHNSDHWTCGSFAIGLMDLNFDNIPEVFAAHFGGSMGNVFIEIYELNTGKSIAYNAAHFEDSDNVCLYVSRMNGKYVTMAEGAIRDPELGWLKLTDIISSDLESESGYISVNNLFTESLAVETPYYENNGEVIEKTEYDVRYQQFLKDYQKIPDTQIQLIKWADVGNIDEDSKAILAEKMANALLASSQKFIYFS